MKIKYNPEIPTRHLTDYEKGERINFEVDFLSNRYEDKKKHLSLYHRHNFYSFGMVLKGSGSQSIDFVKYPVEKNKLFFIYPGQIHIIEKALNIEGIAFSFTEDYLLSSSGMGSDEYSILNQSGTRNSIYLTNEETSYLYNIGKQMYEEFKSDNPCKNKSLFHFLNLFLIKAQCVFIKQNIPGSKNSNTLVKKFINLVKDNYKSCQRVADYAKLMNITPGHLNDTVKLHTGKNAYSFIKERILLEVKRCLIYEDKCIKEIAYELKFQNPAYFSRFVKKYTGDSPESLRVNLRKKYK